MRLALVALGLLLAVGEAPAGAAMSRKVCRASCQSAIASCVTFGGRRAACRRQVVQRCRREGPAACTTSVTSTSTTFPFPTTTLAGVGAGVTVHDVRTAFEIDWYVPSAGAQFALVDVTIDNDSGYGFTPLGFQLQAGGLGFPQSYIVVPDGAFPNCSSNVTILPGGSLSCTLIFEITEGTPSGRLAFGAPYTYGMGSATVLTDEFPIPAVVRPTATLDVLAAVAAAAPDYCAARTGFALLQVAFAYASHDGATGLDLSPYQFVLEAGGAIYDPHACSYSLADHCDATIGVPVDGSASCSLLFEVPASVTQAELRALNPRYPAAAAFTLD